MYTDVHVGMTQGDCTKLKQLLSNILLCGCCRDKNGYEGTKYDFVTLISGDGDILSLLPQSKAFRWLNDDHPYLHMKYERELCARELETLKFYDKKAVLSCGNLSG